MSQCIVPNWNLSHPRQDLKQGEEGNRSSHVDLHTNHNLHFQQQQSFSQLVPMYGYYSPFFALRFSVVG